MSKPHNKEFVFSVLRRSTYGLSTREIVEETGIEERTLRNYLRELEAEGKIEKDKRIWYAHDYDPARLRRVELSPEEAMTLYLASRLFVKQHDKRNDAAQNALLKLAGVLTGDANVGQEVYQAAQELAHRPDDGKYNRIFREVMQAYIYKRRLHIEYEPAHGEPFFTDFEPYLIEPSAIGFSTYAIGRSSIVNTTRTYKIERIRSARLLIGSQNEYRIPADFPGLDILKNAWSIYYGEKTEPIILRFSPEVRERVAETRWHPSEDKNDDPEKSGWLRWTAQIADITDILPWIRGWGADCEVIAPTKLHHRLANEVARLNTYYNPFHNAQIPPSHWLWAKADQSEGFHRLLYHLIDVGQASRALWQKVLSETTKTQIAQWLQLSLEETECLIAFWSALHDLGKASPAFQDHHRLPQTLKNEVKRELKEAGFQFSVQPYAESPHHAEITTWILKNEKVFEGLINWDPNLIRKFAQVLGGHHGAWPSASKTNHIDQTQVGVGLTGWRESWSALCRELVSVFQPPAVENFNLSTLDENVLLTLVSGIVALADWLGSDESFDYVSQWKPTSLYAEESWQRVNEILDNYHLQVTPSLTKPFNFQEAFHKVPRQAQQQILEATIASPSLVIIEAPMGSGKTEAALSLYAHWAQKADLRGLYIAMPTTATSNQMHEERIEPFIQWLYGLEAQTMLIHSRAELQNAPADNKDRVEEDRAQALSWFLPRKKSLLFPFGVGTVDQALMSVLQTKHFFVRLLSLSHKVIIFDEVHAYDVYMNTLFQRLLTWLRGMGTSVILLSATLPSTTRRELLRAYNGDTASTLSAKYPRLTYATQDTTRDIPLTPPSAYPLAIDWIMQKPSSIAERLREELRDGGCAAVICNTVKRAQEMFDVLKGDPEFASLGDDLMLFHARYPFAWRNEIEGQVMQKFGPPDDTGSDKSERPRKAILVATQIIEQSLDLDFDVMVSDFAPIDFLLQRAGRLHRHARSGRRHSRRIIIAAPPVINEIPQFDRADQSVYALYILLRSWLTLKQIGDLLNLPNHIESLIEKVYGTENLEEATDEMNNRLNESKRKFDKETVEAENIAEERLVREPSSPKLMRDGNMELEEDNPELHTAFQALTRLGDTGITLVCLHEVAEGLSGEPDGSPINYQKADRDVAKLLMLYSINVQDKRVVKYFLSSLHQDTPTTWKRSAALRHAKLAIFKNGECLLGDKLILHISILKGLEIDTRKEEK
jgi:CRISPR-associated endonuclease/helicase Cas3